MKVQIAKMNQIMKSHFKSKRQIKCINLGSYSQIKIIFISFVNTDNLSLDNINNKMNIYFYFFMFN